VQHRRLVLALWLAAILAAVPLAARQTTRLSGGGFAAPASSSARVERALSRFPGAEGPILAAVLVPASRCHTRRSQSGGRPCRPGARTRCARSHVRWRSASALVEQMLANRRADPLTCVAAVRELEVAMSAFEAISVAIDENARSDERLLTLALLCRFAAQDSITRVVAVAVEQLGGMASIRGEDVSYLAAASRRLAFHPPSRSRAAPALVAALAEKLLRID
jgi:hypothetical protein